MPFTETCIKNLLVFEPKVYEDARGFFYEAYSQAQFLEHGINCNFVQDNHSYSNYGVVRGLHYQLPPHTQTKLVRVIQGLVLDVAVDLRIGSETFGKWFAIELSAENKKQLLIPAGFAHGFSVLSPSATLLYKCDALYHAASDAGIRFDDLTLNIDWKISPEAAIVSAKDLGLPDFENCKKEFFI